jgi:hypothetical protein
MTSQPRGLRAIGLFVSMFPSLAATPAFAHPGHGLDADGVGLIHFMIDFAHGGGALAVALLALASLGIILTVARAKRTPRGR